MSDDTRVYVGGSGGAGGGGGGASGGGGGAGYSETQQCVINRLEKELRYANQQLQLAHEAIVKLVLRETYE